jgi:hypothetical protein
MEPREAVQKVTLALHKSTDSMGTPTDAPHVKRVLTNDLKTVSEDDIVYVGRIALGNFYAYSEVAFTASDFWDNIKEIFGESTPTMPSNMDIDTHILQIALYITA